MIIAATGQPFAASIITLSVSWSTEARMIAFASESKTKVLGAIATQVAAPMQRSLSTWTFKLRTVMGPEGF